MSQINTETQAQSPITTTTNAPNFDPKRLEPVWITTAELLKKLGFSRSMLSKLQQTDNFPEPIRFGKTVYRWNLAEIEEWIERVLKNRHN